MPLSAEDIMKRLQANGYTALRVGGSVRDELMGRPVRDIDLATDASPEACQALFDDARLDLTGKQFRVLRVDNIEVASFRGERYLIPGKPEVWQANSFEADAARRDFTINAMARTLDGALIDPFGGQQDLEAKLIRAVGEAEQRFQEDPLRLLRALSFAARFRFQIETKTAAAMRRSAPLLAQLPGERVAQELKKLIEEGVLALGMRYYQEYGFLPWVLPELQHLPGLAQLSRHHHLDVWQHTLLAVQSATELAPQDAALAWAALFHDGGKGFPIEERRLDNGLTERRGHEILGRERFLTAARRLALGDKLAHEVAFLIRWHTSYGIEEPGCAVHYLRQFAESWHDGEELRCSVDKLGLLLEADYAAKNPMNQQQYRAALCTWRRLTAEALRRVPFYLKEAGLSGEELRGRYEGKEVGRMLRLQLAVRQSEDVQKWYDAYLPVDLPVEKPLPEGAILRLAVDEDVPRLRRLVNAAYAELGERGLNYTGVFQDEEITRRRMAGNEVWVIEENENLLATISFSIEEESVEGALRPVWYIGQFAVQPHCRKQGFGSLLLFHAFRRAREEGVHRLGLDTAVEAHHLVRFYRRFGFRIVETIQWRSKNYASFIMGADSSYTLPQEVPTSSS